ncbi:hypothetical protein Pan3_31 [Pseudanabaena phage Pan3]|nr:hypothetical protein Pan3_31 [Pseudanabaena phage Pan3]
MMDANTVQEGPWIAKRTLLWHEHAPWFGIEQFDTPEQAQAEADRRNAELSPTPEQVVVFPSLGTSLAQGKATPTPEASS